MKKQFRASRFIWIAVLISTFLLPATLYADNDVMGEVQFEGKSRVEKTSGVWVDGQYVGYLKELKGSKKVLLLPGEHEVTVRQNGYQDFTEHVVLQPGEKHMVHVAMQQGPTGVLPSVTSTVKISVEPTRAAVFVDGLFVGHVGEFKGMGRGMLVAPGTHQIRIALPGYQTFETAINPLPNQKVEIKTELVKGGDPVSEPLLKTDPNTTTGSLDPGTAGRDAAGPPQR